MEHLDERVSSRESYLGHFKSYGMDGAESAYFTSVYKTWSHPHRMSKKMLHEGPYHGVA